MSEAGMKLIVDSVAWMFAIGLFVNVVFFFANLKLYTEIMKQKAQRDK